MPVLSLFSLRGADFRRTITPQSSCHTFSSLFPESDPGPGPGSLIQRRVAATDGFLVSAGASVQCQCSVFSVQCSVFSASASASASAGIRANTGARTQHPAPSTQHPAPSTLQDFHTRKHSHADSLFLLRSPISRRARDTQRRPRARAQARGTQGH